MTCNLIYAPAVRYEGRTVAERQASIPAPPAATATGYGDQFLVWSWRRIITGRTDCTWFAREYDDLCGQDGPEVFNMMCIFLKALGFASIRSPSNSTFRR